MEVTYGTNSAGTKDFVKATSAKMTISISDETTSEATVTRRYSVLQGPVNLSLLVESEAESPTRVVSRTDSYRGPRVGFTRLKEK